MFCQYAVTSGASGKRPAIPTMATACVSATLDRPLRARRRWLTAVVVGHRCAAGDDHLVVASGPSGQLLEKVSASLVHRDNRDPLLGKLLLDFRRRHPERRPRAPVDREDARGPALTQPDRQLVQDLVHRPVIGLAAVADAAGDRAEEGEEAQGLRAQL